MPTLEEYLRFSLDDWQAVVTLKTRVSSFKESQNPAELLAFFFECSAANLVKYAVHWPAFEAIYKDLTFNLFWVGATEEQGFVVSETLGYYDAYKQQLINRFISETDGLPPEKTPEENFYFVAIDCLLKQARELSATDRGTAIVLFTAMEETIGYLGSVLLAAAYWQFYNCELTAIKGQPCYSAGFFTGSHPVLLSGLQQTYISLHCAIELLTLQVSQLPALYVQELELAVSNAYGVSLSKLLESVAGQIPVGKFADIKQLASGRLKDLCESLQLPESSAPVLDAVI